MNEEDVRKFEKLGMCNFCGTLASQRCANCRLVFYCKKECQKQDWKKGHKEDCKAVKIEKNSVLGRHLVATRDFKKGEVIFKDDPLVVGPKQITEPICLSCYKNVDGTYRCSKCGWPMCGPQCEQGAEHHPECVVGQEIGSPIDIQDFNETNHFYEVVLPLRCLTLKKRSQKKYNQLLDLQSHLEERKTSPEYKQNQDRIVNMLRNYFMILAFNPDDLDSSETLIHRIIGILDTNSVDIPIGGRDIAGVYPLFSMIENSCIPNVKISFTRKKQIIVKAAINIKKGEHLSAMYTHILWGTIARREHLKLNKYFMCTCSRCSDPTELGTNFSSLKCQECRIGYLTSAAPLDELADWICSNCNATLPVVKVKELTLQIGEDTDAVLVNPSLRALENLIEKYSSKIVHPNHFHLFATKHSLLQLYGRQEIVNEEIMMKKEKLCQEFLKTCNALDPGMARLATYTSVALYEYHLAIMSRGRQPDGTPPDPQSIKKDVNLAIALLRQCVSMLEEEPEDSAEGKLRAVASRNLKEIEELFTSLP
ncbi:UNVERIFIED_CONTAM: hypothetical protein RMT77_014163 [Armadillidium vulgare]